MFTTKTIHKFISLLYVIQSAYDHFDQHYICIGFQRFDQKKKFDVTNRMHAKQLFISFIYEILTVVFDLWTRSTCDLRKVFTSISYLREQLWIRTLRKIVWKTIKRLEVRIAIKLTSQSIRMIPWLTSFTY